MPHNNGNSFVRSQLRAKSRSKLAVVDLEPTVDEKLTRLEEDIRRLKIEFDVFFNGAAKKHRTIPRVGLIL